MRLCCLIYENLYYLAFYGLWYIALVILQIVCSAVSNSVLRLSDSIFVRCNCLLFSHWSLLCLWSHRVLFGDWMYCCARSGILLEGGFQVLWIAPCTMYFQWKMCKELNRLQDWSFLQTSHWVRMVMVELLQIRCSFALWKWLLGRVTSRI
jgi:hypothetical protein